MRPPHDSLCLCVDDHRIVREGIDLIISREPDMTVVASAATAEEAVAQFEASPAGRDADGSATRGVRSGIDAIQAIRREQPDGTGRRADDVPG